MNFTRTLLALCFAFLLSCQDDEVDERFAMLYAELRVAQQEFGDSEDGKAARLQILQKYNTSLAAFEKEINDIKSKPTKWFMFQSTVVDCLDSIGARKKE